MFNVGDVVTCMKAGYRGDEKYPVFGQVLIVRDVVDLGDRVGLRFVEVVNVYRQYKDGFGECYFRGFNFAKVCRIGKGPINMATENMGEFIKF